MEFEFDEDKRAEPIARRSIDILYAARIFRRHVLTRVDDRRDYGEIRQISLGMVGEECFIVVHTDRDGVTRLITAWKGGRDDRKAYEAALAGRDRTNGCGRGTAS